jgi:hypothetical protein
MFGPNISRRSEAAVEEDHRLAFAELLVAELDPVHSATTSVFVCMVKTPADAAQARWSHIVPVLHNRRRSA